MTKTKSQKARAELLRQLQEGRRRLPQSKQEKREQYAARKDGGGRPRREYSPDWHPAPDERTNKRGERVLHQYGTTKRSRENELRLTDGIDHPVTISHVEPRGRDT